MDELQKSWSAISDEAAKTYLHYFPRFTKKKLAGFVKRLNRSDRKLRILDLGCGNGIFYDEIRIQPQIEYIGIDFSRPLLAAAIKTFGKDADVRFIHSDIFAFLANHVGPKFDLIVLAHVMELVESQDKLLHLCAQHSKHIAIIWYEPPIHKFHIVELKPSAHPKEKENAPYLRIKTGADFYQHLLEKNKLMIIEKAQNPASTSDVLHILGTRPN